MIPIFTSPGDEISSRRKAMKATVVGVLVALAAGLLVMVEPSPITAIFVAIVLAAVVSGGMAWWVASQQKNTAEEKAKRGLDGLDMYPLIDRLVDEIDDDEADYLRRRLDEREHAPQREVAASIEELLDKRAQEKRD